MVNESPLVKNRTPVIQRAVNARVMGGNDAGAAYSTLRSLAEKFGLTRADFVAPIKNKLFEGDLFPDTYKHAYDGSPELQAEVRRIVYGLDDLIAAVNSTNYIVANSGDANSVAVQLYHQIRLGINQARLDDNPHYKMTRQLGAPGTNYIDLVNLTVQKLGAYEQQIDQTQFDLPTLNKNEEMGNRIAQFKDQAKQLVDELKSKLAEAQDPAPVIAQVRTFIDQVGEFEHAWDLDKRAEKQGLEDKINTLASHGTASLADHYKVDGGTDDHASVGDAWGPLLACSLYSILALKGKWLGTDDPEVLHRILRKTGQLKEYDDNRVAGKVRYLAGLTPTAVGGINLSTYIGRKKERGEKDSFIVDVAGVAHTFAAVWKNDDYKKVDETGSNGNLGEYGTNEVLWIWQ